MKTYSIDEIQKIIQEIEPRRDDVQNKISETRQKRENTKIWDLRLKKKINLEIEDLLFESMCYNYSLLMLQMYEDSIRPNMVHMDDDKLIQCEKKAELGDGISKLIVFCHKCFIEHTIVERDLKRLELEVSEGNITSAYILFGYNTFFAD